MRAGGDAMRAKELASQRTLKRITQANTRTRHARSNMHTINQLAKRSNILGARFEAVALPNQYFIIGRSHNKKDRLATEDGLKEGGRDGERKEIGEMA